MRRLTTIAMLAAAIAAAPASAQELNVPGIPVPRAECGPGSQPEPPSALQGEITAADRESGRSTKPYTCNLELVGQEPGEGGSWQHTWYSHCAYYDSKLGSGIGTYVIDVSDPAKPKETRRLTSIAMQDPWESLSVAEARPDGRKLLAGVYVNNIQGGAFLDVYDVEKDCRDPEMVFSGPVSGINHEGNWSMDGMTYWSSGSKPGTLTPIDMTDPALPKPLGTFLVAPQGHGLSTSDDGNRVYYASQQTMGGGNGLVIVDSSRVQSRTPAAQLPIVSELTWTDGATAQHTLPVTIKGRPYILFVDEAGAGAARFIDISDETKPKVVSELKLEIHLDKNAERAAETASGIFGYNAHYCGVDRRVDPTIVVCSMFNSGMRVFDVRDPLAPREIAYYNPGGTGDPPPPGSQWDFANPGTTVDAGYPSARPRVIADRGEIWFTDQNKGFHVVRFTNGVWPFRESGPAHAPIGLPKAKRCLRGASVRFRIKRRGRSAVVYVNGKRAKRLRGRALRRRVRLRLPKGHSVVRVVVTTRSGKRIAQSRDYTRCT